MLAPILSLVNICSWRSGSRAEEVIYGFALAIFIGFTLGVLVGETAFGEKAVMPYLVAIDTMPKVAFAPLFVAWLGFDIDSKVALAAFIATFPIVVGTAAGLHAADENARMLFKTMGASRMQTLIKMKLPSGLPQIFTGLKIGAVGVMAGAITGEFLGGGKGFGELIRIAASQLNTPRVFSLILYLSVVGLVLYLLVQWTQRRVCSGRRKLLVLTMADGQTIAVGALRDFVAQALTAYASQQRMPSRSRASWSRPISTGMTRTACSACGNTLRGSGTVGAIRPQEFPWHMKPSPRQ